jgi:hypothetical protein
MKYLKFLIISLVYVFILILYLINDGNKTLLGIIFDSFGINCLTALYFLFLLNACKTTLPNKFHKIREFEKSSKLYKLIGVRAFKFLLAKNPLPTFTGNFSTKGHSVEGLYKLEKLMRNAETLHFQAFLTNLIVMLPFTFFRDTRFLYFMIAFNIIVNLYPVLVQIYNRNRIDKILSN